MANEEIINNSVRVKKRLVDGSLKEYIYMPKSRKAFNLYFDNDSEKLKFEEMLSRYKTFYGLKSVNDAVKKALDDSFCQHGFTNVSATTQESIPDDILSSASNSIFLYENN